MAHNISDHAPKSAARTGSRIGVAEVGRVRASEAFAVYDRHDALFSLALLLCQGVDRSVEAVVATVTQSCGTASDPIPDARRQSLLQTCGTDTRAILNPWHHNRIRR